MAGRADSSRPWMTDRGPLTALTRVAFDALPYLVWTATADGRAEYHNAAMREYVCRDFDVDRGERWTDCVHPDDQALSRDAWDEALRSASSYRCELRLRCGGDPSWRWHLAEARPIRDEDAHVVRWCGSLVDVQDRHDAEDRLRESVARMRRALLDAPLPMILFAEDGEFLLVNEAFVESTGYSREHIADVDTWLALPPGAVERDERGARFCGPFRAERREDEGEFVVRTRSGEERIWNFFTAPVGVGTDGRRLLLTMADDVTERKRAERRLHVLAGTLEQRVEDRTRQLAEKTDQLRRLACELGLAEERERRRLAEVLHDHVQQLLVATRMQLSVARRNDEEGSLRPHIAGAEALLGEALGAIRSLTAELRPLVLREEGLGAALRWLAAQMGDRYDLDVETDIGVDAEPGDEPTRILLYEAARELLFNVVKHADVRTTRLVLLRSEGMIRLRVEDDGAGFDASRVAHAQAEGGGFGLADIRERSTGLGGRLVMRSRPGSGATVEVVVPEQ